MKVRALQSTFINGTYRRGPEFNDKEEQIAQGDVFEVEDDFEVNPEVLEVLVPPKKGEVRYVELPGNEPASQGKGKGKARTAEGSGAATETR